MTKKEKFQMELLIDYALDLNNISRESSDLSFQEKILIDKIEVNVKNVFLKSLKKG